MHWKRTFNRYLIPLFCEYLLGKDTLLQVISNERLLQVRPYIRIHLSTFVLVATLEHSLAGAI
jgi:hypothetical protein